jgi:Fe-Mn family superoxide dismutase
MKRTICKKSKIYDFALHPMRSKVRGHPTRTEVAKDVVHDTLDAHGTRHERGAHWLLCRNMCLAHHHEWIPMIYGMERRDFIRSAGLLAGVAATTTLSEGPVLAQTPVNPEFKPMTYEIKPLPFDPKAINGLSEKILVSHYENNYIGAVKRLNAIGVQLAELDYAKAPVFMINGLKREELIATNSMILHEAYFEGLGGGGTLRGPLGDAIARDFGSINRWRTEFAAMGKAEGGGSGWVILAYSPRDKRLVNQWAADHTTTLAGGRPVLVLDMYEHAYHMDFGAKAASYVDAYMEAIRWDNAVKLYERYSSET